MTTDRQYCVIGAGPAGLSAAKNLKQLGLPFVGFEAHTGVGGLWDIKGKYSTMYESAHLISSKRMTEFADFPMRAEVADYPHHAELHRYFGDFATHFGLREHYRFGTEVGKVERLDRGWRVTSTDADGKGRTEVFRGVLIANGTLSEPNIPPYPGRFDGELMHSARYKSARIFEGKRVLIVGCGNSACDIAVDAVHRARSVAISVRRGYHFVPKYVFGKPVDTIGGRIRLPRPLKQRVDSLLLWILVGDVSRLGFPKPDYRLYESHPVLNTQMLYHVGHGDIRPKADVREFAGQTVRFADGSAEEFDLVLLATGYKLHYPFMDRSELNWQGAAPQLYLNCFHPARDDLFVLGMVEAAGLGWQARNLQGELVARFLKACEEGGAGAGKLRALKSAPPRVLDGGFRYLKLDRMAYYVHKETYFRELNRHLALFR